MTQKTIRGKKCPKCSSFMEDDAVRCGVCGSKLEERDVDTRPESNHLFDPAFDQKGEIKCSKCGAVNNDDYKFCKICKHPLKGIYEEKTGTIPQETTETICKGSSGISLSLDWSKVPGGYNAEKELSFVDFSPYFDGYLQWKEYAFFVYRDLAQYEILIRKIKPSKESKLYKKCKNALVARSGKEFYLGAVKFQLVGGGFQTEELKTIVMAEKTFFRGPGEKINEHVKTGRAGLKVLNFDAKKEFVEIREKVLIGRTFLAEQWEVDENLLRKNGISKEHMYITPMEDGNWLMEPVPDKALFVEIGENPQILDECDVLRWLSNAQIGEFKIGIKINASEV